MQSTHNTFAIDQSIAIDVLGTPGLDGVKIINNIDTVSSVPCIRTSALFLRLSLSISASKSITGYILADIEKITDAYFE